MRFGTLLAAAVLALATGGCDLILGPDDGLRLGYIAGFDDDDPHVTVPATARAGEPFTVTVRTYGPSGCWSKGDTHVLQEDATATILPYDRQSGAEVCTAILSLFDHDVELTFDVPGAAQVVVRGRDAAADDVLTLSFTVEVLP